MDYLQILRFLCVGLSAVGLILPTSVLEAAPPRTAELIPPGVLARGSPGNDGSARQTLVEDVELDQGGFLHGFVVDAQGTRVPNKEVVLRVPDRELARARTDVAGRFRIGPVRGGTYQLTAGEEGRVIRAWTASTAPPAAERTTLLVIGGDVVRGQMPLECFFASDAVILAGLVAAMIALPIAINGSKSRSP